MFYVYSYVKDSFPYYVGKGCGNRAYQKQNHPPLPTSQNIHIVREYECETQALIKEWELISFLGLESEGGLLVNKVKGCAPPSRKGAKQPMSEEHKAKLRKPKPPRSAEHSEKIAKQNRGKNHTEEHRRKISEGVKGKTANPGNSFRALSYVITTPEGVVEEVYNLAPYCKKHNLTRSAMCLVAKGKANHHKGYKVCYK